MTPLAPVPASISGQAKFTPIPAPVVADKFASFDGVDGTMVARVRSAQNGREWAAPQLVGAKHYDDFTGRSTMPIIKLDPAKHATVEQAAAAAASLSLNNRYLDKGKTVPVGVLQAQDGAFAIAPLMGLDGRIMTSLDTAYTPFTIERTHPSLLAIVAGTSWIDLRSNPVVA